MTNPFRLFDDPYRHNPFALLEVKRTAGRGIINDRGRQRQQLQDAGRRPVEHLEPPKGSFANAARALRDPTVRLLFDLIHHGLDEFGGESHDRADWHRSGND